MSNLSCHDTHLTPVPSERKFQLNPEAPPFVSPRVSPPQTDFDTVEPVARTYVNRPPVVNAITSDFTRYLLKKDLLLSRLINFNDKAETYNTWKFSFCDVMRDLGVGPQEETDLLLKWSGPESQKHVLSIKAANIKNPEKGLRRIWERLDERYGAPEMVHASLKHRLETFPKLTLKDTKKLYELSDIVSEIEAIKEDETYGSLLGHFDSSTGVIPIVNKLPYGLQQKWTSSAVKYCKTYRVTYPPFGQFANFLREQSRTLNNPSFMYESSANTSTPRKDKPPQRNAVVTRKTELKDSPTTITESVLSTESRCPIHNTRHSLNQCRGFKDMPIGKRRDFLREKRICFRCCETTAHSKPDCTAVVKCSICSSCEHPTGLHVNSQPTQPRNSNGGESPHVEKTFVRTACTQICGNNSGVGKSCAKTLLVNVYPRGNPESAVQTYMTVDDQSNRSLANSSLFDQLGIEGEPYPYVLSSCSGKANTTGRRASDLVIESYDGSTRIDLPHLIECDQIPNCKEEIPTPQVAESYPHLRDIVPHIPPLQDHTNVNLLIGRDVIQAHHVLDQRVGSPYAQRLPLGWTIIGQTCLHKVHAPQEVSVYKTYILPNGRSSIFPPCPNNIKVQDSLRADKGNVFPSFNGDQDFGANVFVKTPNDEKVGLSVDDRKFLELMDREMSKNSNGNWEAPLPFKDPRPRLPNNRNLAYRRAKSLDVNLQKNPEKQTHFITFMDEILSRGHAELAPPIKEDEEVWYLPIFGVYHPQKKDQIRAVFDSSAEIDGISLNKVLLTGPDLTNSLLGVLMRFRQAPVGIMADIQKMFYCFYVNPEHRNYLRFFWYRDNDLSKDLVEFRMKVHVFGNTTSPAVATYGLQKTASKSETTYGSDVREFVERNFYVDDALTSLATPAEAISLLQRTQDALRTGGNLKLHKVASNSPEVLRAFPSDLARDLKDLDLASNNLPTQRSLGLKWDLVSDVFTFKVTQEEKPYTRRGVLSRVNSLYDPLGFIAPITIQGRLLLRKVVSTTDDWDDPLPPDLRDEWEQWVESLQELNNLTVPRSYGAIPIYNASSKGVHIFSDASEKAIGAVAYIRTLDEQENAHLGFVLGKSKLAPSHGHTIPRLELCGAVLAVEIAESIAEHLDMPLSNFHFYSDSRVVLGYISNENRRFYTYVANRVERIRQVTNPPQWSFVSTEHNPADLATRTLAPSELSSSMWLSGPSFWLRDKDTKESQETLYTLENPDLDKEVRPEVKTYKTEIKTFDWTHRFEKFSTWNNLVVAIARLQKFAKSISKTSFDGSSASSLLSVQDKERAQMFILQHVQRDAYHKDMQCLKERKSLPKDSSVSPLDPTLDEHGMLRVGGRLRHSGLPVKERNPILIPGRSRVAKMLVLHYHNIVKHQGRHITAGAVRSAGFWVTGGNRLVSSLIHLCVTCRKLRGKFLYQKMADLPRDRVDPGPPFTNVGVDCFGPWQVVSRKTRGGQACSKRWAVMFTCLTSRAVHIEVIEELSSSSFINALRRFISIRGPVKIFRSDRGTNFVGSVGDLNIDAINCEDDRIFSFLQSNECVWLFNPPHASHMGGAWERMIGLTRRILDSLLVNVPGSGLTHEVLTTFLAETCTIINSRPLTTLSADPNNPYPLSQAMLLTQKPNRVETIDLPQSPSNLYRAQWKRVQILADMFWRRWNSEYLQSLQQRVKWKDDQRNLSVGDIVLLRDKEIPRNQWPMGVVVNVFPGNDGRVRKVEVKVCRVTNFGDTELQDHQGKRTTYIRPVTELVLLIAENF